ncbi:hypothetical protein [Actinomycetospora termitidis]|uniref:Uncharacterized protein n=1 Tax=Actinomycetospora termitidis TaxID=3053470 RepID=A0ABT7M518_9PSEU|nr:hypothetical protein [Actinomycetospora sp. Odt1-22]MDL5155324.1 hypothetical protein [Actinomycetospora sp. Odt1-22]
MNGRALLTAVVAVLLLAGAGVCLSLGVDTSPSTGGLLVTPVPLTRILGGWVAAGVALVTAALLCVVDVVARVRRERTARSRP